MDMFFSIIVPTYNRATSIGLTLDSVINQTYSGWELIIVDDGSTDNTKEVVSEYLNERISYYYQDNSERSVARNFGFRCSVYDWVIFLDSDDLLESNCLAILKGYIENDADTEILVSFSYVYSSGHLKKKIYPKSIGNEHLVKSILDSMQFTPMNFCIKRSCLYDNSFEEKYKEAYWEDTHLFVRLALKYRYTLVYEYLSTYVHHANQSVVKKCTQRRLLHYLSMVYSLQLNCGEDMSIAVPDFDIKRYFNDKVKMFGYRCRIESSPGLIIYLFMMELRFNYFWSTRFFLIQQYLYTIVDRLKFKFIGKFRSSDVK